MKQELETRILLDGSQITQKVDETYEEFVERWKVANDEYIS